MSASTRMYTIWSSIIGLFSGKSRAKYIRRSITPPARHPHFTYLLNASVRPTKRSPNINSQSTTATPAKLWKISAKGPFTPKERKPVVGDPPCIHALSGAVANPSPNVLSKNAQRKTKLIEKRSNTLTTFNFFIMLLLYYLFSNNAIKFRSIGLCFFFCLANDSVFVMSGGVNRVELQIFCIRNVDDVVLCSSRNNDN